MMYIVIFINCHLIDQYTHFFDTEVIYLQILLFKVLMNLSATADFPSLCVEYISIPLSCNHDFNDLL